MGYIRGVIAVYKSILPQTKESTNYIKTNEFVEIGDRKWRNGFTEIRKLGTRYVIRHEMNPNYHVTNLDDMGIYIKYFLRLNGY